MATQTQSDDRQLFSEILTAAGYTEAELKPVPNASRPDGAPWYKFATHMGDIVIGRCGQGINLDWSDTRIDLHLMYCSENTPKGDFFIHAPDKEKAIDYLMRIWLNFFRREPR